MARNFNNYTRSDYIGQITCLPISIGPEKIRSLCVPVSIPWFNYDAGTANPNLIVNLNFNAVNSALSLKAIRSVYIDNSQSDYTVSVIFPDTAFVVNAAPNSAAFYPVISASLNPKVTITGVVDGDVPTTNLIFTDVFIPPYSDLETDFIIRGEFFITAVITNIVANATAALIFSDAASGSNVINSICLTLSNITNASGGALSYEFDILLPNGVVIFQARTFIPNGVTPDIAKPIYQQSGLNLRFAADLVGSVYFRSNGNGAGGSAFVACTYTYDAN